MTPEQKAAIAAKLGADLAPLDNDRLIELCLLHRAQPKALESFPNALTAEINRRFSAAEIARDDVPYSILQHFANQFTGVVPYFHRLMQDMAATVNRDIWFTDNAEAFKAALANEEAAAWLAGQTDILNKCLGNRLALGYIAQSTVAATAILTRAEALAQWKNAPALWDIWPQHAAGMQVLAKSAELVQYIIDTAAALKAVVASETAMKAVLASETALKAVVASETAMKAVLASETALKAVVASETAMKAVLASETALKAVLASETAMKAVLASETAIKAVVTSETAMKAVAASETAMKAVAASSFALKFIATTDGSRKILMAHNKALQAVRTVMYETVQRSWKKILGTTLRDGQRGEHYDSGNSALTSPANALVFVCLGSYSSSYPGGRHRLEHPDGSISADGGYRDTSQSMIAVDGVSFAGAKVKQTVEYGGSYAEVWAPQ
ncbi:hypothetical protein [Cardiobacterium valvarum]|uniref:Uncharacterized protein n=1 Tax=Cardiobacterium valvarum TaxID=194702 RepID=A0A381E8X9_9GAMM|nr:hypothetical protein [Cardiobacterium valvarum]SUX23364.1 Uncharacterised protein [Cardiobacterium valvarum]